MRPPALQLKEHLSYGLVLYHKITCMFVQWILNHITAESVIFNPALTYLFNSVTS